MRVLRPASILRPALLLVVLAASLSVAAESQPMESPRYDVSISVGYVTVPFVAIDQRGRAVRNLRADEVRLFENGRRIDFDIFERIDNAPVSFTILLDGSGSMALAGKLEAATAAIRALIASRLAGDDYALHLFASGGVEELVPFTSDGEAILAALDSVVPWGKTAFYDALARMPDKTILGQNPTRVIILLTDGIDNASVLSREQLTRQLATVDVPVYPLALKLTSPPADEVAGPEAMTDLQLLEQIAFLTGGRVAVGSSEAAMRLAISTMTSDLRAQYVVGFTPTGRGGIQFRPLSVHLARGLRAERVRAGYSGHEAPQWRRESRSRRSR